MTGDKLNAHSEEQTFQVTNALLRENNGLWKQNNSFKKQINECQKQNIEFEKSQKHNAAKIDSLKRTNILIGSFAIFIFAVNVAVISSALVSASPIIGIVAVSLVAAISAALLYTYKNRAVKEYAADKTTVNSVGCTKENSAMSVNYSTVLPKVVLSLITNEQSTAKNILDEIKSVIDKKMNDLAKKEDYGSKENVYLHGTLTLQKVYIQRLKPQILEEKLSSKEVDPKLCEILSQHSEEIIKIIETCQQNQEKQNSKVKNMGIELNFQIQDRNPNYGLA